MPKWEYRIELIDTSGEYLVKEGYYPSGDPWAEDAIQQNGHQSTIWARKDGKWSVRAGKATRV